MAGWTDYCPDWSSKDALRLCSVYDGFMALWSALRERGKVTSFPFSNMKTPQKLTSIHYFLDNAILGSSDYFRIFDNQLKYTAGEYVNHTCNNGDFLDYINLNNTLPRWTWSELLDGENDAVNAPCFSVIDYLYQRYKVINKLKWLYTASTVNYSAPTLQGSGEGATIADACNAAIAAAIQTSMHTTTGGATIVCGENSSGYTCTAYKQKSRISIRNFSPVQYDGLKATASIYIKPYHVWDPADLSDFDGGGVFYLNQWSLFQFDNESELPLIVDFDWTWPNYPLGGSNMRKGYGVQLGGSYGGVVYGILKFTGANGFQFKDW